jgi:DNA repair exonuclease SbcCD ATPase subunit
VTMRRSLVAFTAAAFCLACPGTREHRAPMTDTRDAHTAQLEQEVARLRQERDAAVQTSTQLDESLREVETGLTQLVRVDADIRELQKSVETGLAQHSSRQHVRHLMEQLQTKLSQRANVLKMAQSRLTQASTRANALVATARQHYLDQIALFQKTLEAEAATNARLTAERDELAGKYELLRKQVTEEQEKNEQLQQARAEAEQKRDNAERLQNEVRVVVASVADLRKKGIVTGRWYQRKIAQCGEDPSFTPYDVRTLTEIQIPAAAQLVRVYTPHPQGTYTIEQLDKNHSRLAIGNAVEFWKTVRCAVIGY